MINDSETEYAEDEAGARRRSEAAAGSQRNNSFGSCALPPPPQHLRLQRRPHCCCLQRAAGRRSAPPAASRSSLLLLSSVAAVAAIALSFIAAPAARRLPLVLALILERAQVSPTRARQKLRLDSLGHPHESLVETRHDNAVGVEHVERSLRQVTLCRTRRQHRNDQLRSEKRDRRFLVVCGDVVAAKEVGEDEAGNCGGSRRHRPRVAGVPAAREAQSEVCASSSVPSASEKKNNGHKQKKTNDAQ